jgi:methylamine dehydrogenase light chain
MTTLDRFTERTVRYLASRTSRRGFISKVGLVLLGAASFPLLPVARTWGKDDDLDLANDPGDPMDCDYWRYCAIDGFLCSCCGGTKNTCPPGTELSPITWIGTCRNPGDGRDYIISYNDCCGQSGCGRCTCMRDEGDRPIYRPSVSNNINWCQGSNADMVYNCSTAIVIGTYDEE